MLLFCATDYLSIGPSPSEGYKRLLCDLGLKNAYLIGLTMNACTCAITALRIADKLLADPDTNHILIASPDKVMCEQKRVSKYAVFSDGAVSCLVSRALIADSS